MPFVLKRNLESKYHSRVTVWVASSCSCSGPYSRSAWKPLRRNLECSGTTCIKAQFSRLWCGGHLTARLSVLSFSGYIHWMFWFIKAEVIRVSLSSWRTLFGNDTNIETERDINFGAKRSSNGFEQSATTRLWFVSVGQNVLWNCC